MIAYQYIIRSIDTPSLSYNVTPYNIRESMDIVTEMEEDNMFFRKKLKSGIVLADIKADGCNDYTNILKDIEENHSDEIFSMNVYLNDILKYSWLFTYKDIDFDDDRKVGSIKLTPYDNYQKIFDVWETEVNILDADKTNIYDNYYSSLEFYATTESTPIANEGWKLYYHADDLDTSLSVTDLYIYAREYCITSINTDLYNKGFDYINPVSDGFRYFVRDYDYENYTAPADADINIIMSVRATPTMYQVHCTETGKPIVWDSDLNPISGWNYVPSQQSTLYYDGEWHYSIRIYIKESHYDFEQFAIEQIVHRQAIELRTAIDYILNECGLDYTCKSTFLFSDVLPSVKPAWIQAILDERSTYNYITRDYNELSNIYLIEKSDYKRPLVSDPATISKLKLSDLLADLNMIFLGCLRWEIDVDGYLRIEHIRYFNSGLGIDLSSTRSTSEKQMSDNYVFSTDIIYNTRQKYKYTENVPQREVFKPYEAGSTDFNELQIVYNTPVIGTKENKDESQLNILITDCEYVTQHVGTSSDDGIMIVACDETNGDMYINYDIGYFSGSPVRNGRLSPANLFNNYGRDYRYRLTGVINDQQETFNSIRPDKEGEKMKVILASDPTPNLRIKTDLGYGIIKDLTKNIYTGKSELTLQYDNLDYYELTY